MMIGVICNYTIDQIRVNKKLKMMIVDNHKMVWLGLKLIHFHIQSIKLQLITVIVGDSWSLLWPMIKPDLFISSVVLNYSVKNSNICPVICIFVNLSLDLSIH